MKSLVIIIIAFVLLIPINVFAEETSSEKTILSSKEIPSWIKNTAAWWSEDIISDEEFLEAISFLRESQIIITSIESEFNILNNTETITEKAIEGDITKWHSSVSEAIVNPSKSSIMFPKISGQLESNTSKIPITITISKPNNEVKTSKILTSHGKYSTSLESIENNVPGIYSFEIKNDDDIIETKYAFLDGSIEKIPSWIKNSAGWWAHNEITDDDFLQGIQYLVKSEMIKPVNTIPEPIGSILDSYAPITDHKKSELLALFESKASPKTNLKSYTITFKTDSLGHREPDYQANLPHLLGSTGNQDCMTKARSDDGRISSIEKGYCEQKNRTYYYCGYMIDANGKRTETANTCTSDLPGFGSSSDYGGYSGYYGYNDADVQRYLDRADYYAKQWLNDIEPYAQQWANGKMSYNEYERIGMQSFDYYSDQFVNEYMGSYP
jgi:hypothetical protein